MASDFLIVNGVRLDVRILSASRELLTSGSTSVAAAAGEILDQRRQGRRRWQMSTTCKSRREAQAIQTLIEGYSHALAFDGETSASTSLSPSSLLIDTVKVRPDGGHGGGLMEIAAGAIVRFVEAIATGEEWTAVGRIYDRATMTQTHVARRSDGAFFVNGVRSLPVTPWPITYSNGVGFGFAGYTVAGIAADMQFSDCAIIKAFFPDEWVKQIAESDCYFGPSPLLAIEGSMIDSDLGIFAAGNVEGGAFVQHGSMLTPRAGHPEDQPWQNNELEITFSIVEDHRISALDALPFAGLYTPLTERAKVTGGTAAVVTNNAANAAITGAATLVSNPSGKGELWARFLAGATFKLNGHVDVQPDVSTSKFSISFWLFVQPGTTADVIGAWGAGREWKVDLSLDRLGFIVFDEANTAFLRITTTSTIPTGRWLHVVAVHDTAGVQASGLYRNNVKVALFIDGVEVPVTASAGGVFQRISSNVTQIGVPDGFSATPVVVGLAHIAPFAARALTRAEIRILYRLGRRGRWLRRV